MTGEGAWCIPEQTVGEGDVVMKPGCYISRGDAFCPRCGRRSLVYEGEGMHDDIEMDVDDGIIMRLPVRCVNDGCGFVGQATMVSKWTRIFVDDDEGSESCMAVSARDPVMAEYTRARHKAHRNP